METGTAQLSNRLRPVVAAIFYTVTAFLVGILCSLVALFPLFAMGVEPDSTLATVVGAVTTPVGFVLVGYLAVRRYGVSIERSPLDRRAAVYVVVGVVVALVVANGASFAVTLLDLQPDAVLEETAIETPSYLLILAVLSIVLIGPAEEFVFRGVVQGRLRESFGPVASVVGASLLFGSLHLLNYTGTIPEMIAGSAVIVCASLVFGALYELSGSLTVPAIVHGLYNAVLMIGSYLVM